jgi:succinate-acetate transporter protein
MFDKIKKFFLFKNTKQQIIIYLSIWTIFTALIFISIFDSFDDKVLLIALYIVTWIINLSLALLTTKNKD